MNWDVISSIIQNISIVIASVIAIRGINSWRSETKWKRKYELLEDTLVLFYEVNEKVKIIRSPMGHTNEGKTRKRKENETSEEADILDQAYVVFERFELEKESFLKLQAIKFRFIAVFGKEYIDPFDEVRKILNEIFMASNRLGRGYWMDQGRRRMTEEQFENHLNKMEEAEKIIWDSLDENDLIRIRIQNAVEKIETLYNKLLKQ